MLSTAEIVVSPQPTLIFTKTCGFTSTVSGPAGCLYYPLPPFEQTPRLNHASAGDEAVHLQPMGVVHIMAMGVAHSVARKLIFHQP